MARLRYTIAKKADQSTEFVVEKIKDVDEQFSNFFIRLSEDSPTQTFKDLQEHDLLIGKKDYGKGNRDNILEIHEIKREGDTTVIKACKLSKEFDGSTGYDVDDKILFLARLDEI